MNILIDPKCRLEFIVCIIIEGYNMLTDVFLNRNIKITFKFMRGNTILGKQDLYSKIEPCLVFGKIKRINLLIHTRKLRPARELISI